MNIEKCEKYIFKNIRKQDFYIFMNVRMTGLRFFSFFLFFFSFFFAGGAGTEFPIFMREAKHFILKQVLYYCLFSHIKNTEGTCTNTISFEIISRKEEKYFFYEHFKTF